jgi:hypothetical protein
MNKNIEVGPARGGQARHHAIMPNILADKNKLAGRHFKVYMPQACG